MLPINFVSLKSPRIEKANRQVRASLCSEVGHDFPDDRSKLETVPAKAGCNGHVFIVARKEVDHKILIRGVGVHACLHHVCGCITIWDEFI